MTIPDDPSTLFLLGVILTMVGYWLKSQIEGFSARTFRVESENDKAEDASANIRVDLREIETKIAGLEKKLENHDRLQELVTRLDERVGGLVETIQRQPQATAMTVAAAVTAAVKEVLTSMRGRAPAT